MIKIKPGPIHLIAYLVCLSLLWCGARADNGENGDKLASRLTLDSDTFDFGKVDEGALIKHDFAVSNSGSALLRIFRAYASCGCTTAKLGKNELEPGESTHLFVTIDTAMKQDKVTKTVSVTSNDPVHPLVTIRLLMDVKDPHSGMSPAAEAKIFTDPNCSSCHVARGAGLFGMDLYNADCAMCHGPKAEGAVGPLLFGPYDNSAFKQAMTNVICDGSKTHRSMPGFSAKSGGPLSREQIDSIVAYLEKLSRARGITAK